MGGSINNEDLNYQLKDVHHAILELGEQQKHQHDEFLRTLATWTSKFDDLQCSHVNDTKMSDQQCAFSTTVDEMPQSQSLLPSNTLPGTSSGSTIGEEVSISHLDLTHRSSTRELRQQRRDRRTWEFKLEREHRNLLGNSDSRTLGYISEEHGCSAACVAKRILNHKTRVKDYEYDTFECAVGFIIAANAIAIGLEGNWSLANMNSDESIYDLHFLQQLEYMFLAIYYLEILIRVTAKGWGIISSHFVLFDALLVVLGTLDVVLSALYDENGLEPVLVVRVLRLFKSFRALRAVKYFKVLWTLVFGLMQSFGIMLSTMVILTLSVYIGSCLAIELISKDPLLRTEPDTRAILDVYFCDVSTVMLVFVQFVTMDSLASIYFPLVKRRPGLVVYFLVMIVTLSIALMNLVTAVLVEAAIASGKTDKELERRRVRMTIPKIQHAFDSMDLDADGTITKDEVEKSWKHLPPVLLEVVPEEHVIELFDVLDIDSSGSLSKDEFVDGVKQMMLSDSSFENLHLSGILKRLEQNQLDAIVEIECLRENVKHAIGQLDNMGKLTQELSGYVVMDI